MKNLLWIFLFFIWACGENAKQVDASLITDPENNEAKPTIVFETDTFNFGIITQGEKVKYAFKFTNSGKGNLIISSANGSCGCTVPSYPKKPIAPGEQNVVEVVFDSDGKEGLQNKTVTLVTNAIPNTKTIYIKGEIIAPLSKK
jgi:hypothetical protein